MIDIQEINPQIVVELKYATPDNFTGQTVYDFNQCFLVDVVAEALNEVQKELEKQSLGLKVWDGYRPMAAQERFWELVPDERYVSNPKKGGRHTRGTAVDVTLIDFLGNELEMPSAFDDFTEKAHRNYEGASETAIKNRKLLESVMQSAGFQGLASEWWHFDFTGWETFPVVTTLF